MDTELKCTAEPPAEPTDFRVAVTGAVGNLAAAALWPAVAMAVFLCLRRELQVLARALTDRIRDKDTSLTVGSVSIVSEKQGEVETLKAAVAQLRAVLEMNPGAAPKPDAMKELDVLAQGYASVKDKDWSERVRQKDELGRRMGALVYTNGIPRKDLLAKGTDAYLTALAHATLTNPERSDAALLCEAAKKARMKHTRYAISMALGRLASSGMVSDAMRETVRTALDAMAVGADDALEQRIGRTRLTLEVQEVR